MDAFPELLTAADPPPVEHVNAEGKAPVLITCDHASRRVPKALRNLGVDAESLKLHIGWDIGAADVARGLARRLDAPAVLAGYSRLVIDCNRDLDDPTSMPAASDGVPVPGNQDLSPPTKAQRVEALFRPYHRAIETVLDGFAQRGVHPAILSIHSFTPVMNGVDRPWHIGILWDKDPRMAQLAAKGNLKVGDAFVHESIIGSLFEGRVEGETRVGGRAAIRPSVAGWARVTGYNTIFVDDRDPYAHGFQLV